jgi:hypothetical protein
VPHLCARQQAAYLPVLRPIPYKRLTSSPPPPLETTQRRPRRHRHAPLLVFARGLLAAPAVHQRAHGRLQPPHRLRVAALHLLAVQALQQPRDALLEPRRRRATSAFQVRGATAQHTPPRRFSSKTRLVLASC